MKKLMLALAVAAMAGMCQAVSVQWSSGVINGPDGASIGNTLGSWTMTLTIMSGAEKVAEDTVTMTVTTVLGGPGGTRTMTSRSFTGSGASWSGTTGMTVKRDYADVSANADYTWSIIVEGENSKGDDASKTLTAQSITTGGAAATTTLNAGAVEGWAAQAWKVEQEQNTPNVPEPTSGLLMLVGLGALALRRRRA